MNGWEFDSIADCWRCAHCHCKETSGYHERGCPKRDSSEPRRLEAPGSGHSMTDTLVECQRLAHELATQDNAITSDPIFVVQQKHRQYGMDMDYCEHFAWVDSENPECSIDDDSRDAEDLAQLKLLEAAHDGEIPWPEHKLGDEEMWTRTGYLDRWEFVQPFLTREAAEAFRKREAHNLRETRVYVESGYRNPEWQLLRALVATLGAKS